jgi:hypothetical protein
LFRFGPRRSRRVRVDEPLQARDDLLERRAVRRVLRPPVA